MPKSKRPPKIKPIDALRDQLLTAQVRLTEDKAFAVAIIVTGEPTAGRSEVVNQILEWLDPKRIHVYALDPLGKHKQKVARPSLHRYWLTLPARGEIAIYFQGWYEDYLAPALHEPKALARYEERIVARIKQLEAMLTRDRVRILKLDMRVDQPLQQERVAALRANKATRWRVTREDRWLAKHFDRVRKATDRLIKATSTRDARWHVVDGSDPEGRLLHAGALVLQQFELGRKAAPLQKSAWPTPAAVLKESFATRPPEPIDDEVYERELETLQGRLARLSRKKGMRKRAVVLVFEGMDAAGKGGAIRRMTAALDARQYTVIPISAPSAEELARPYLWRFWRRLPDPGEFAIFDRSWYGRVLVERVRDLAAEADWQRAYDEIKEFELQLTESNIIVQKFWLALGKDEQLERFKARESEPLKRFKVDREDWANRRFFDDYQVAAREMIERTSVEHAPWTVVEADNKKYARLKVLRTVCERIEAALVK